MNNVKIFVCLAFCLPILAYSAEAVQHFSMYDIMLKKTVGYAFVFAIFAGIFAGAVLNSNVKTKGMSTYQKDQALGYSMFGGFVLGVVALFAAMAVAFVVAAAINPGLSVESLIQVGNINSDNIVDLIRDTKSGSGLSVEQMKEYLVHVKEKMPQVYDLVVEKVSQKESLRSVFALVKPV